MILARDVANLIIRNPNSPVEVIALARSGRKIRAYAKLGKYEFVWEYRKGSFIFSYGWHASESKIETDISWILFRLDRMDEGPDYSVSNAKAHIPITILSARIATVDEVRTYFDNRNDCQSDSRV